jgi:hypothetical protein
MASKLNRDNIASNLFTKKSSKQILIQGLKEMVPTKGTYLESFIILVLVIAISSLIGISNNTVILLKDVVEVLNNVTLAVFGIIFTGYAIFQALIDTDILKRLFTTDLKGKPFFSISNDYFIMLMIVNALAIFINMTLLIILKIIPEYWCAFDNHILNNAIAITLISFYLYFEFKNIWEIKSFVFNIYQMFNISAGEKIIKIIDEEKKES